VSDLVLVDDADGVRTLTLNRPEARNAFNTDLYRATGSALDGADADESVRVVILTGAGKGFSAGQDLKEMAQVASPAERDPDVDVVEEHGFRTFIDAIEGFSKPLIAAVHGAAVGIGTTWVIIGYNYVLAPYLKERGAPRHEAPLPRSSASYEGSIS